VLTLTEVILRVLVGAGTKQVFVSCSITVLKMAKVTSRSLVMIETIVVVYI
jgi:hypothetical protein